jgi:hypothetical protein
MSSDPSAETWRYNPSPGQWTLNRAPARDEALLMAAECATAASDNMLPVPASMARAEAAKAWAAIAAVAPTDRSHLADFAMPAPPSYLFGLDAGHRGNHGPTCSWPLATCVGHPEYVGCVASLHIPQPGAGVRCSRCGAPGMMFAGHGEAFEMCGDLVPEEMMRDGLLPYRCTEPADHDDEHHATLNGVTVARWS